MGKYLLGIDLGTSACKVALFNSRKKLRFNPIKIKKSIFYKKPFEDVKRNKICFFKKKNVILIC